MLEMVISIIILLCIIVAVKANRVVRDMAKSSLAPKAIRQNQYEPRAHRLCIQAHELHSMPNDFSKIKADEDFKRGIKCYVNDLAKAAVSNNTVNISVNKVTQLYPKSAGETAKKHYK